MSAAEAEGERGLDELLVEHDYLVEVRSFKLDPARWEQQDPDGRMRPYISSPSRELGLRDIEEILQGSSVKIWVFDFDGIDRLVKSCEVV